MQETIERLRNSKEDFFNRQCAEGTGLGSHWLTHGDAKVEELRRLEQFRKSSRDDEWEAFFREPEGDAWTCAERLFFVLRPDDDGDRQAAEEFWKETAGENAILDGDWLCNFAESALSTWDIIKPEI